ncbi:MAG: ABC transporter permease [Oscillospiraceae bacterium]|nr:ABC transporter permease [Oscillospiraceae bacterium]
MIAIFKRDFIGYFTSAIGYVYLGSYILVLNLMFYLGNMLGSSSTLVALFGFMLTIMMFITPILTMRVFSEEFKLKTDQALYTLPVKLTSVVLGKFLSSMAVFGCLLVLTLLWPLTISILGENNISEVVGNYVGILCIGAAYISIGVFISSLTENQVIAAVGSLGVFIALYILDMVAMFFFSGGVLPVWVMRILVFVSIYGRYTEITQGLLALDTIIFFLSVCAVFLFLTVRRLEKRKL